MAEKQDKDKEEVKLPIVYKYAKPQFAYPGIPQRDIPEDEWKRLDVFEAMKKAAIKSGIYVLEEVKNGKQ